MSKYLFRISTKRVGWWSHATPTSLYIVHNTKEDALNWATNNLSSGLSVAAIKKIALQIGGEVFIGGKENLKGEKNGN